MFRPYQSFPLLFVAMNIYKPTMYLSVAFFKPRDLLFAKLNIAPKITKKKLK